MLPNFWNFFMSFLCYHSYGYICYICFHVNFSFTFEYHSLFITLLYFSFITFIESVFLPSDFFMNYSFLQFPGCFKCLKVERCLLLKRNNRYLLLNNRCEIFKHKWIFIVKSVFFLKIFHWYLGMINRIWWV